MRKVWIVVLCALLAGSVATGIYFYRHRYVRSDADLLKILPGGDVTTFFANVQALRDSGLLKILTGSRVVHEKDYERFVHQVNFDYTKDLDRLAGTSDGNQMFVLLQGRFDWERLRRYPGDHGGRCANHVCSVPTSTPGRWASFHLIQPDVLALAFSSDTVAVNNLAPPAHPREVQVPPEPVWVQLAESLLKNPGDLPIPVRIFAMSLQSANPVLISAGPAAEGTGAAFRLKLDAACQQLSAADTIRNQLEIQTRMLGLELHREGKTPDSSDLTGLLTAGTFQIVNKHVIGSWPVRYELLRSLQ